MKVMNHLGDEIMKGSRGTCMKVIVIRQPWAWLIVNGIKDIENRSWRTRYRGPLLIQASARKPAAGMEDLVRELKTSGSPIFRFSSIRELAAS